MSELKNFNWIAIGIPIFIALFGILDNGILIFALLSTMLTGLIQVLLGFSFWLRYPKHVGIIVYFLGVICFFVLLFIFYWSWLWVMPPVLCFYLTYIFLTHKTEQP